MTYCDIILTIVNVYGPNIDDPNFNDILSSDLQCFTCTNVICGGDFNFIFNLDLDKLGGIPRTNFKARDQCLSLIQVHDLVDIWRERNPLYKAFTWSSNNVYCRLDLFLTSRSIVGKVTDCFIQPSLHSDHSAVILKVSLKNCPRGRGYWKLNNSLLLDSAYTQLIESIVTTECQATPTYDPASRWERVKYSIRKESISFSIERARRMRCDERSLLNEIAHLENVCISDDSVESHRKLDIARCNLKLLYKTKLDGIIVRSRARWVEEGEKSSKYFLNLESRHRAHNVITKLKTDNDEILTENADMLKEIRNYYYKLYDLKYCKPSAFFARLPPFDLDLDLSVCEGQLTLQECYNSLSSMSNGKSPGSDGLSVDFYKNFGL